MPDEPRPTGPIELDEIVRRGAILFGTAVSRLAICWEDGRKLTIDLPAGDAGSEPASTLTELQAAVLQVIDESATGAILTVDSIATKAGYPNTGHLREFVRRLSEDGRLKRLSGNRGWEVT